MSTPDETQIAAPAEPTPAPAPAPAEPVAAAPVEPAAALPVEPATDFAAKLAEFEAKTKALEADLATQRAETRALAFTAAFDRAGVAPAYRDYLRAQVGDIDPRTDAGLKAIDDAAKRHPAMLVAHVSTEDPMVEFLRAKAEEAKKSGAPSMWGLIPPGMLRGYDVGGGT